MTPDDAKKLQEVIKKCDPYKDSNESYRSHAVELFLALDGKNKEPEVIIKALIETFITGKKASADPDRLIQLAQEVYKIMP